MKTLDACKWRLCEKDYVLRTKNIIAWVAKIKYETKLQWLSRTEADRINYFLDSQDEYKIRVVIWNFISMTGEFILTYQLTPRRSKLSDADICKFNIV